MNKNKLKYFFIKLIAITFAVIIIINTTYNLIFADKLENINSVLSLGEKENRELIKNKIRQEIKNGLKKEYILNSYLFRHSDMPTYNVERCVVFYIS